MHTVMAAESTSAIGWAYKNCNAEKRIILTIGAARDSAMERAGKMAGVAKQEGNGKTACLLLCCVSLLVPAVKCRVRCIEVFGV